MIATALATLLIAAVAMAPGVILCRGERLGPAGMGAAATASLTVAMMATSLLGIAVHLVAGSGLPAPALLGVSLAMALAALWYSRDRGWQMPRVEWQGALVAAFFVAQGIVTHALAVTQLPDGALRIHAWYNADWFKHVGHSYGIADYGLPARDIFGNALPLHYYWLSHVLPGAGTALGGNGWAALYTANAIYGGLLAVGLYGVVRLVGASANLAGGVAALATFICAPVSGWLALLAPVAVDPAMASLEAPPEPALSGLALYIPQHALALALLLSWAVLALRDGRPPRALHLLALASLATAMTVSTLFGAAILATYGLTELLRRRLAALPELAAMAVLSALFVLALGVVDFGTIGPDGGLGSTGRTQIPPGGALFRGITSLALPFAAAGLPALLSVYLVYRWKPADGSERNARLFAVALLLATGAAAFLSEVTIGKLVAHEMRLRVLNLLGVASAVAGGWALQRTWMAGGRTKAAGLAVVGLLVLAAAPAAAIRLAWHAGDDLSIVVPADDRAVLAALHRQSAPHDVVWQFPAAAVLSIPPGVDSWSVVFAGRTNLATTRATNPAEIGASVALAERYFAGQDVPVPSAAGWIYLSRELHPASYDELLERLERDPRWSEVACRPNACLFARSSLHGR